MIGLFFIAGPAIPRLIKGEFAIKPAVMRALMGSFGLGIICGVLPWFNFVQGLWVGFGLSVYIIFGILLPGKYLQNLDKVRYAICMMLMLMMIGVFLKMTLRLGFNVKYIFTLPQYSLNI